MARAAAALLAWASLAGLAAAAEPSRMTAAAPIAAPPQVHADDPLRFAIGGRTWFADPLVSAGWCYGSPGAVRIVYLPDGGPVRLAGLPGRYRASWFDPREGTVIAASGGPDFVPPAAGDWALHVAAIDRRPGPMRVPRLKASRPAGRPRHTAVG